MERLLRISATLTPNTTSRQVVESTPLEVRYLKAPKLGDQYILKKVIGFRPQRRVAPNLSVEKRDDKVIAHNYGHGGSGWTLAPGSAAHILDLLEQFSPELKKDTPITIIGAGVIGLFTAYLAIERGYKNLTIVSEAFDNLTSHVAGGLLAPIMLDGSPEFVKMISKIGLDAYTFYKGVSEGRNPILAGGAEIVPAYFKDRESSGLEPYVPGVMKPAKDVIVDFGNGTQRQMVVYDDGIFMHTQKTMKLLQAYLKDKVKHVQKKVYKFNELSGKYIINCTGLGARELNGDNAMLPVQGHLIMLKDQDAKDLKYMVMSPIEYSKNKHGQKLKRSFYFFPKQDLGAAEREIGLVGGTFVEGAGEETLNEEEFEIVLKNAREFVGEY